MNSITALNLVRNSLRDNLVDLYSYIDGASARPGSEFIFGDEPLLSHKHPTIQLKKIDNPTEVISMGYNYTEFEQLFINVWVYVKNGFNVTISGTKYSNAEAVEYLVGQIKTTLKEDASNLHDEGVKMYKHVNTTTVDYLPDQQLYACACTIRVAYFNT